MDNKGFTLIELLSAIVILAIIMALAIPSISSVSKAIRTSQRKNLIDKIEIAASNYAFDTKETNVFVNTLVEMGYIESDNDDGDVIDPLSNNKMNCYIVTMKKKSDYYVAEFQDNKNYQGNNGKCDITKYEENDSLSIETKGILTEGEWSHSDAIIELSVNTDCVNNECVWTSNKGAYVIGNKIEIDAANKLLEAKYTFRLRSIDLDNGEIIEETNSINLKIDNEPPIIYEELLEITDRYKLTKTKKVTVVASDRNGSGIKGYYFDINNGQSCNKDDEYDLSNSYTITSNGNYIVCVKDNVGNTWKSTFEINYIE